MRNKLILKDCYNRSYCFTADRSHKDAQLGTALTFFDQQSSERFLRDFDIDFQSGHLASMLGCPLEFSSERHITDRLCCGKIMVYALPNNYDLHRSQIRRTFSKKSSNERFSILTKAESLTGNAGKLYPERDAQKISALLNALAVSDQALDALSNELLTHSPAKNSDRNTKISALAQQISAGNLLLHVAPTLALVPSKTAESTEPAAQDRAVPLAPASEYWIEVTLLDENGNAFANQEYSIEDAEGKIHKGNTNAKGNIRVDRIPAGDCKVSFPKIADC